ncbi:MAG: sugar phosphate isomerase/epimerase family protein [Candidatus Xenobiia bacterium LiM19]
MKLAISHIAWPFQEESFFLERIKDWGCSGLEIAPSRIWNEPYYSSSQDRKEYLSIIQKAGLEVVAIQALLYTRPDLGLFREAETEKDTISYLQKLCLVAHDIGAKIMVFGSPSNRKKGIIPMNEALERASSFFSILGNTARELGVFFCIEPLGPAETDFINTPQEGLKLVEMVSCKGFGLHLDSKALSETGSISKETFLLVKDKLKHFHISESDLTEINSTGRVDHQQLSENLKEIDYKGYVSIEMKTQPGHFHKIKRSIEYSYSTYL